MKNISLIIFTILLLISVGSGQEFLITEFLDYKVAVNKLEEEQQFEAAIKLTNDVWQHFPEKEFDLMKELIYLNSKTGRYNKNLELWKNGHQKGYFFLLNTRIKKYEPYLKYSQFKLLVKKDEELRLASFEKTKTIYEVLLPGPYDQDKKYPVTFILHGGGSNLQMARHRWHIIPELKSEYIIVYLQSYRSMDWNTYGWTSGDERAHRDVRKIFTEICRRYVVDTTRVLLGGMSAGGTMAFDLGLNGHLPLQGIIAFCPGKPWKMNTNKSFVNDLKVFMVGGEKDYYLPKQKELTQIFDECGINYSYQIIPGMGHTFPDDYEKLLREALLFLN